MDREKQRTRWRLEKRAQRRYPIPPGTRCAACGSRQDICRHHKDFDKSNNYRSNIALLCRHCHIRVHIKARRWGIMKNHEPIS